MEKWFEITIPHIHKGIKDGEGLSKYRSILKNNIFPAIDELNVKKLIKSYHFLMHILPNHKGLDFRLLIINPETKYEVEKILVSH